MADEISARILNELESAITKNTAERRSLTRIRVAAEKGTASFRDANEYARLYGKAARGAISGIDGAVLPNGQMQYNIASETIGKVSGDMTSDVLDVARMATKAANSAAGIGMNPVTPNMADNVQRLVEKASSKLWDDVKNEVATAAETLSKKCVDETVRANARTQLASGLDPRIERTASSGACQWCAERSGSYRYEAIRGNSDIFGRHANCDCVIEFVPGKKTGEARQLVSSGTYRQNKSSLTPEERERRAEEALYRKSKNTGPFSQLDEPMQMRHVRSLLKDVEADYHGASVHIDRNERLIGTGYCGYTDPSGKRVTLYPDAFKDRENLVKTLGHEGIHLDQVRKYGAVKDSIELTRREKEARNAENSIWQKYLERTGYGKQRE